MIVEHRTYTLVAGRVGEYFELYEKAGLQLQLKHLGRMAGYYRAESGDVNQVIHLWAFDDAADREQRRARLSAEPEWPLYVKQVMPLILKQESRILRPAPFFEPSWLANTVRN